MTRLGGARGKTILISGCGMSDRTERAGVTESTPGNSVGFLDGALSGGHPTVSAQPDLNSLPSRASKRDINVRYVRWSSWCRSAETSVPSFSASRIPMRIAHLDPPVVSDCVAEVLPGIRANDRNEANEAAGCRFPEPWEDE